MILNNEYRLIQGYECFSACIGNVLGYINHDISGNEIIILGDGMKVIYDSNKKIISSEMYASNLRFLNKFRISYVRDVCDSPLVAESFLCEMLDRSSKLILKTKAQLLTYNRVFSQAGNSAHYINVLGYNEDNLYICDGYVPTMRASNFSGWVSKEELLEAWKGVGYEYLILQDVDIVRSKNIRQCLKAKVLKGINDYITGENDNNLYFGQAAVLKLFEDIKEKGTDNNREDILEINYQLKIYGFLSLKNILKEVLVKDNSMYTDEYEKAIREWNSICIMLVKCAIENKDNLYDLLFKRVKQCVKEEEQLLKLIYKTWVT